MSCNLLYLFNKLIGTMVTFFVYKTQCGYTLFISVNCNFVCKQRLYNIYGHTLLQDIRAQFNFIVKYGT